MAIKIKAFDRAAQEIVGSGDTLIIRCPRRRNENEQNLLTSISITPEGAASVDVFVTLTPWTMIAEDPGSPSINYKPWTLGTITSANSATAYDTFTGMFSAIKVVSTGGKAVVDMSA
jgi:hypothetical protein